MKTTIHKYCLLLIVLLVFENLADAQVGKSTDPCSEVTLERTVVRNLHSKIVGKDYEIFISLPRNYRQTNSTYPVVYITDSYRSFSIIKGFTDVLTFPSKAIPDVILVGIGYGGDESNSLLNWAAGRTRDLTPVKDSLTESNMENNISALGFAHNDVQTGGAPLFLDFIRNELFPFINSNYRSDPKNLVLYGYSFGGLFGLYTLFHAPETFDKYIIGSPSIHYKDEITFNFESSYAKSHSELDAVVFMSSGGLEEANSANVKKMESLLLSRNYPGLKLKTNIFEGEGHTTCAMAAISRGLMEVFK